MSQDRKRAQEATARVLDAFFAAIGTPAPAPGIERLALIAVESAYLSLRESFLEELEDPALLKRAESRFRQEAFRHSAFKEAAEAIAAEVRGQ